MNIRKLFDEIRSADLFNAFWEYPEEKNLSVLASRLPHIKSPKELRCAIAQICNYVFEENEEGSFPVHRGAESAEACGGKCGESCCNGQCD
ncbi:hypothetical protein NERG_02772 [Nematocida ausubeli]|uniref:Uncharacterized protein n=1 Tax=Nematocida ausubeli (strain ATCC PRA-371 / ERTm2) TaxID=1913371 RepID=H8Z8V5_NEMA1|nr:hypothetical protein NERG_02772 [Nematocida ausubeli]